MTLAACAHAYPSKYEQILACVHCGFRLPSCPTYRALGAEPDSLRGRIYIIKAIAEERIGIQTDGVRHLYRCVLCRGCEEVCPSGVKFGQIMEHARGQVEKARARRLCASPKS